jgi:hypothetical protein
VRLALLFLTLAMPLRAQACPLEGTFVQIREPQTRWGRAEWGRALDDFASLGMRTIVLQHTGDPYGSYEGRWGAHPITHLLDEADERGMEVWLGLAHAPGWPYTVPDRLPPLGDPRAVEELGRICEQHSSCEGFYLSTEIDDRTWSAPDRSRVARALMIDAVRTIRGRVPRARIAIAPFFSRALDPDEHARWWASLLGGVGIDVVMLQGGTGTGRASADDARFYIRALATALARQSIEVWLVVELFEQLAGPPVDDRPFSARAARFEDVEPAILEGEAGIVRRIAFSVLDYMNPRSSSRGRALRARYRAHCPALADRSRAR